MKVLFDVDVADERDELLEAIDAALEWHGEAFIPGQYLAEALPILRYIPPWVPGATVQRLSVYWRCTVARVMKEIDRLAKVSTTSTKPGWNSYRATPPYIHR